MFEVCLAGDLSVDQLPEAKTNGPTQIEISYILDNGSNKQLS